MDTPDLSMLTCRVCKHEWKCLISEPRRCPNPKCRSVKWRDGKDNRQDSGRIVVSIHQDQLPAFERAAKVAGLKLADWFHGLAAAAIAAPKPAVEMYPQPQAGVSIQEVRPGQKTKGYELAAVPGPPLIEPVDDWQAKAEREFGHKFISALKQQRGNRAWERLTWEERYNFMASERDRQRDNW